VTCVFGRLDEGAHCTSCLQYDAMVEDDATHIGVSGDMVKDGPIQGGEDKPAVDTARTRETDRDMEASLVRCVRPCRLVKKSQTVQSRRRSRGVRGGQTVGRTNRSITNIPKKKSLVKRANERLIDQWDKIQTLKGQPINLLGRRALATICTTSDGDHGG
jgi:hypothetical protein